MEVDAQRRRELLDLRSPLLHDAHRTDHEGRAERVDAELLPLGDEHRDRLHRLAEAHVVGEDRADAEVAEHPQPTVAAFLERKERERHRGRSREGLEVPVAALQQLGERRVERDLAQHEPSLVGVEARDGADELHDPGALAALLEEAQRLLDLGPAQRVPAAADLDERLASGRELGDLLLGQDDVADGEPPVELRERRRRQQAARDVAACGRVQVHPQAGRRRQPCRRQQDRHAAFLEPRHRFAQERAHRLGLELDLRRLGGVELDPELDEQRLDLRELQDQVAARVARAQEREHVVGALPQEQCREPERRIVLGLEPQLEHERRRTVRPRPLVEVQAERPRRSDDVSQAVVHPAREPPVEGGVPGGGRQERV